MVKYAQTLCKGIGDGGCYFLALVQVAEKYKKTTFDVLAIAELAIKEGIMTFDYKKPLDDTAFYVKDPALLLEKMTGQKWQVVREDRPNQPVMPREYVIDRYKRVHGSNTYYHFVFNGQDTLATSPTRELGEKSGTRVCKVIT